MAPAVTPQSVQQAVADALQSQGMRLEDAPPVILQSVARQAQEALAGGQKLDAAAALRKAQFEAVGMTGEAAPTLGQVTRDPMQYANERNLVGVRIKTPQGEGNPLSDRFQNAVRPCRACSTTPAPPARPTRAPPAARSWTRCAAPTLRSRAPSIRRTPLRAP
jgi:hypothetical protein